LISYIDQEKNATDVLKREGKWLKTLNASTEMVCKVERIIHHTLEMRLYVFGQITHEWFAYENYIIGGRSLNDFQLPLEEDQSFSLFAEEGGYELEGERKIFFKKEHSQNINIICQISIFFTDDEITIKDFMDNVKLIKRQINENLKISEETTMDTSNESSQKLRRNRKHVKKSNVDSINKHLNYLRLKYILTLYRWISNIIIYNTIGKTSLGNIFPHLRECQPMFPVKETNEQLKGKRKFFICRVISIQSRNIILQISHSFTEFEEISEEIIYLTQLLQTFTFEI